MLFKEVTGIFLLIYCGRLSQGVPVDSSKGYRDVTYNINIDENALEGKEIDITLPAADTRGGGYNQPPLWTGLDPDPDGPYGRREGEQIRDETERKYTEVQEGAERPLNDFVGQALDDGFGYGGGYGGGHGGGGYGGGHGGGGGGYGGGHGGGGGGYGGGGHHGGGGSHHGGYHGSEHGNFGEGDGGGHHEQGQHSGGTQYGGSSKHDSSSKWYGGSHSNGQGKHGTKGHFHKHYKGGNHGQYKKGSQDHYKHHGGKVKTYTYGGHGWYKEQTHGYHQGHGGEHGHKKGHHGGHKHGKFGSKENPYWSSSDHFGGWKQHHSHN